jgi:aminomethyltransferase
VERRTPLLDAHVGLGAKLTNFAGWDMPLSYTGVVAEHQAVRTRVGVFDVSHLGKLRVAGPQARDGLDHALTADAGGLSVGRARYSLVLNDRGGCIDDVFLYRLAEEEWMVVPNAANVSAVAAALRASGAEVADEWDRWAILALQGPASLDLFARAAPESGAADLGFHECTALDFGDSPGLVARTGYTGERGLELFVPARRAPAVFDHLVGLGARPVGLGARDTLRLEMGYALYGHELAADRNPLEAGLAWAIAWHKPFRGRDALLPVRESGPRRRLVGVRCTDRGVPRQGYPVEVGHEQVATVTSGNFSPTLGVGIALALGSGEALPVVGAEVAVAARGRRIGGIIVAPPFVKRESR